MRLATSARVAAKLLRVAAHMDVRTLAPRVACPTLVLHARDDARVPFEEGRLTASLIPGARFVAFEGRNHILVENEPAWARFVSELRGFLSEPASPGARPARFAGLSRREEEILEMIAAGLANRLIAQRLHLSDKTVRNHINRIFRKLDVDSRAQAIVMARDAGLGRSTGASSVRPDVPKKA
jgi:DNA-binding CsgD family transcriptional regulator